MDAQVGYEFQNTRLLHGLRLALSATNLLDRGPPHIAATDTTAQQIAYDPTNANAIGRLVSLTVTKAWW